LIRRIFDDILNASARISSSLPQHLEGFVKPSTTNELRGIVESFQAVEKELQRSFTHLEKRASQLSTLKELSDLCYVTFDSDDLFAITMERAMSLANADVGSVLILEGKKRETFVVHATYGLGELVKKGDRTDFATSIAKFAVINKSPLIIDDIEKDSRFGRENRSHYGTKSFLCMPLKGINEVFGVLTLSRKAVDLPFTYEDADVLTPLLSNAAFTYDNLNLIKTLREKRQQLATFIGICKTLSSSLRDSELLHAVLNQFGEEVPFDAAVIFVIQEKSPDRVAVREIISSLPLALERNVSYDYTGSVLEAVIKQGNNLFINDIAGLEHPLDRELIVRPGLQSCFFAPLKMEGLVTGLLFLGNSRPASFTGIEESLDQIASLLPLAVEKNRLSLSVRKRDQEMGSLKQIGSMLAASTFDREEVLKHTMDMIRTMINVEAGSLLLLEKEELVFETSFNINPEINVDLLHSFRVKLGEGISGYSAASGEPVLVKDVGSSRHFKMNFDQMTGFRTRSELCVPLISRGKVLGVIEILNKIDDDFNDDDLHLLQSIATSVSIALENSRLYQETLSMAESERGIRKVFQKFVPREIVDKIIHNTESDKPLLDELKILTLLNIDIRGFSALSQKIGPQRTVAILNHFFACMGEIVFKQGGIVDKYLGDGFLAVFGAPVSTPTDADHAIAAALEMQGGLQAVNDHFSGEIESPLAMGISIHTGEALVGNIGFEKKMDYTVIGDSVNVVFRIQDLTKSKPNSIFISEKTRIAAMNSILDIREIGKYHTSNILGELMIYELLGSRLRDGSSG
jgi:class 3 adenylate cyclase/GAF domain-containing protein